MTHPSATILPFAAPQPGAAHPAAAAPPVRYAELQVTSDYSFLRGASSPEQLLVQAKAPVAGGLSRPKPFDHSNSPAGGKPVGDV